MESIGLVQGIDLKQERLHRYGQAMNSVLHDVDEEVKGGMFAHSKKMAT